MTHSSPTITVIDIETSPIIAAVWKLWDVNVGLNQIIEDWSVLSFAAKRLDAKAASKSVASRRRECLYADTSAAPGGPRDDYALLEQLWTILNDSDIIVGQNVRRFDLRKIRARMMLHGMSPPSPCRVLDTLEMAKSAGAFTSNKLEYLSGALAEVQKAKHKKFPGHELWAECEAGNPAAWKELKTYNILDVLSTEEVYLKLRPWAVSHLNLAVFGDPTEPACPVCASTSLMPDGEAFSNVSRYQRYRCQDCGAWSRSRYSINTKTTRRNLLSK